MKKKQLLWILPSALLALLAGAFFLYTGIYYHADEAARDALVSGGTVSVSETGYGWYFDGPGTGDALIFYPGAKVEETAYAPFLRLLAEKGLDVCLVRMPFRLAFFGLNKADGVRSQYAYERWFVGGHSLGGAMAAVYAAGHGELSGVVLCAAYPTKPLDREDLEILVYGSEDGVLNREKLAEGRAFATDRAAEYEIPGGNHAQFGAYGQQSGDGEAKISREEQQTKAADFILKSLRGE